MIKFWIRNSATLSLLWHNKELFIWITALVLLYRADLHSDFTLCIPSQFGVKDCTGCGIGHAITVAMHGDFTLSWEYHKLGIPALIVLLLQIRKLIKQILLDIKIQYYGQPII